MNCSWFFREFPAIPVHCCCQQITVGFSEDLLLPEQRPEDVDLRILRNVRGTSARSCALMDELKTLKTKVYGLENDLRHL